MAKRDIRYEPVDSKLILNPVKAQSMPFDWSINPYRGCQHGCSFCYARSTHAFLGIETDDTFQNRILVKQNAKEVLERQLRSLCRSGRGSVRDRHVAVGTATDPYQPIEAKAGLTRDCLELLAEYGVPVSITTRSPLILRDIDVLKRLRLVSVNISVGTMDTGVWKAFEPSTPSPAKRLETVRALSEEGLAAGIFLAPLLPYLTDTEEEVRAVLEGAKASGARFVMTSYLRLSTPEVKGWFMRTVEEHYPQLADKYARLYAGRGYAPNWYTEPRKALIRDIRRQLGIPSDTDGTPSEPIIPPAPTESVPEQLTFAF